MNIGIDFKKIDTIREAIGKNMVDLGNKLVEWGSNSVKDDAARFASAIKTLYDNNRKLLTRIAGVITDSAYDRIERRDETIWYDKKYMMYINREICDVDSKSDFDFVNIFGTESQNEWGPEIHEDFWKRVFLIAKLYRKLLEYDPDMKSYRIA